MTECVILFRNPGNGEVGFLSKGEGDKIATWPNFDEAVYAITDHPIGVACWPYQIIELDEL